MSSEDEVNIVANGQIARIKKKKFTKFREFNKEIDLKNPHEPPKPQRPLQDPRLPQPKLPRPMILGNHH